MKNSPERPQHTPRTFLLSPQRWMQFQLKRNLMLSNVFSISIIFSQTSDSDGNAEDDEAEDQEDDGPRAGELRTDAGHFPVIGQ